MQAIAAIQQVMANGVMPGSNPALTSPTFYKLDADTQLVERCLSGEQAAWEDLVRTHNGRVYGLCYRFTNSATQAQDLSQEVFLRVFKSLSQFRAGKGTFSVWLTRLTRNLLIDHYRKTKSDRATDSLIPSSGTLMNMSWYAYRGTKPALL